MGTEREIWHELTGYSTADGVSQSTNSSYGLGTAKKQWITQILSLAKQNALEYQNKSFKNAIGAWNKVSNKASLTDLNAVDKINSDYNSKSDSVQKVYGDYVTERGAIVIPTNATDAQNTEIAKAIKSVEDKYRDAINKSADDFLKFATSAYNSLKVYVTKYGGEIAGVSSTKDIPPYIFQPTPPSPTVAVTTMPVVTGNKTMDMVKKYGVYVVGGLAVIAIGYFMFRKKA